MFLAPGKSPSVAESDVEVNPPQGDSSLSLYTEGGIPLLTLAAPLAAIAAIVDTLPHAVAPADVFLARSGGGLLTLDG